MGISVCGLTLPLPKENSNTIMNKSDPTGQKQITITMNYTLHHDNGMIPPKGIFLVCGDKAYPYFPKGWAGSCYLALLFPDSRIRTTIQTSPQPRYRCSASESVDPKGWAGVSTRLVIVKGRWWEKAIGFFMPHAGTTMNSVRIDKLSQALEYLGNVTMAYYTELTDMLVSMRAMVMQNRVALDMLLAEQGGVCRMIEGECCV